MLLLWAQGCAFRPSGAGGADDGAALPDASPGEVGRRDGGGGGLDGDGGDGGCGDLLPFVPSNIGCDLGEVGEPFTLDQTGAPYLFDTDSGRLTRPDGTSEIVSGAIIDQFAAPDIYVVATTSFTLGPQSALRIGGSRALAAVSTSEILVAGTLDAAASGEESGPGGDDDGACENGRGGLGQSQSLNNLMFGGSGGGGGALAASGGSGAPVESADDAEATPGGEPEGSADLVPLRGGCAGGPGGIGGVTGGLSGGAGGALQLVAAGTIRVDGIVTASGGGGGGIDTALNGGGGGGGGSGGGLLFEALAVEVNGAVTANGGGGGEGTRTDSTTDSGSDGLDDSGARAPGGDGSANGGDGGAGGAAGGENGENGLEGNSLAIVLAGGGGGGGSAGRIRLSAISGRAVMGELAVVSPAAQ